jgi:hypothetical protein
VVPPPQGRSNRRDIDLGTWHCITPYVGGRGYRVGGVIGFATISVDGLKDVDVPKNNVFYAQNNTETNFAWGVYGGLAYDASPSLTLDLSYRCTNLGDASSGRVTAFGNSSSYKSRPSTTSPPTTSCWGFAGNSAAAALSLRRCGLLSYSDSPRPKTASLNRPS